MVLLSCFIGVGRFRILGGGGGKRGPNSRQAHNVVTSSMRRNDVALTLFRRHVPTRFLIIQCQIIRFLILKSGIIESSRIELRGIVLPVPSNQIKVLKLHLFKKNMFLTRELSLIYTCYWRADHEILIHDGASRSELIFVSARKHMC